MAMAGRGVRVCARQGVDVQLFMVIETKRSLQVSLVDATRLEDSCFKQDAAIIEVQFCGHAALLRTDLAASFPSMDITCGRALSFGYFAKTNGYDAQGGHETAEEENPRSDRAKPWLGRGRVSAVRRGRIEILLTASTDIRPSSLLQRNSLSDPRRRGGLWSRAIKSLKGEAYSAHHGSSLTFSHFLFDQTQVLEDYDALEKGNAAHRIYASSVAGNKISILAGDFLLSRASVLLSSLRNTAIVEIMASALEAIMKGQMQLHRPVTQKYGMETYQKNLATRTGNLLGSGCQCVALVAGYERQSEVAQAAFEYGMHVGVAYQMMKDLKLTEKNYDKLLLKMQQCLDGGECPPFDPFELNEPLQRAGALMYAIDVDPELEKFARGGFDNVDSLLMVREKIVEFKAVEGVQKCAEEHVEMAIKALSVLPQSIHRDALQNLAYMLVEPSQYRIQRASYDSKGNLIARGKATEKTGTQVVQLLRSARQGARLGLFSMGEHVKGTIDRVSERIRNAGNKGKDGNNN
eukprot:750414-Hanusia_phi.AAC.9